MTEITIAGETFNVRLEGDETREVLALAHQLGGSLAVWEPLMPVLLERFRVLRWDSRGHGGSVANAGPYSVAQLARDAIAIFDALGIDKVHWLGLSMGAIVGQAALIATPERIGRAILANTAAQLGTPDIWNARIQAVLKEGMKAIAGNVAARWFTAGFRREEPEIVEAILCVLRENAPEGYAAACAAVRDVDQREAIRSIRSKVLVIAGRDDPSAPPELAAYVASAIEGAKLVTLDAAHISHLEQTSAFLAATIDFLTASDTPARNRPSPRTVAAGRPSPRQPLARRAPKTPARKTARESVAKTAAKTAVASAAKAPPPKTLAKKPSAKRMPAKKTPTKKSAAGKTPPAKAVFGKMAAKKAVAKTPAVKKIPAKTSAAKTSAAKKIPTKKGAVKNIPAKKGVVKKTPVKAVPPKPASSKGAVPKASAKTKIAASKSGPARKGPRRR